MEQARSVSHNTFDLIPDVDGNSGWTARSHNYPDVSARGGSEQEAVEGLHRALLYFADNNPIAFRDGIKRRVAAGLECACGHRRTQGDGPMVGTVGTRKGRE